MPVSTATRNKGVAKTAPRKNRVSRRQTRLQKTVVSDKAVPGLMPSEAAVSLLLDVYSRFERNNR
jgi:hypothetical protein